MGSGNRVLHFWKKRLFQSPQIPPSIKRLKFSEERKLVTHPSFQSQISTIFPCPILPTPTLYFFSQFLIPLFVFSDLSNYLSVDPLAFPPITLVEEIKLVCYDLRKYEITSLGSCVWKNLHFSAATDSGTWLPTSFLC